MARGARVIEHASAEDRNDQAAEAAYRLGFSAYPNTPMPASFKAAPMLAECWQHGYEHAEADAPDELENERSPARSAV